MSMLEASLEILRGLFGDKPEALKVFDLQSLESQYLKEKLRDNGELFADAINLWVTGRTGAGKTSLGNSLLDSDVMKSNGFQDCTDFLGYFRLTSNLRFWDTPGIGSNINYENINRAALMMEQLAGNKFSRPPVVPLKDSDYLLIKDFSKCLSPGVEPEKENVKVGKWRLEMQEDIQPDVILYVLAPHMKFLDPDRQYLGELLETWKNLKNSGKCIIIPILNVFRKDDGTVVPTSQEMTYAKREIPEVYKAAFETDDFPPVIEINSKTGEGIPKITEMICQILPPEKIGSLGKVLKDDLKGYAEQERVRRYYQTLSLISGRLGRYTVDKKIEGQSLFQAAASAICAYGVMTFKSLDAIADIKTEFDSVVDQVEQVEGARRENITTKENVMGTKDITRIKPKEGQVEVNYTDWRPEKRTETVEEEIYVPVSKTKNLKKTVLLPGKVKETKERSGWGKFWTGEDYYTEEVDGYVERTVSEEVEVVESESRTVRKDVTTTEWVQETKTKLETRVVGYEEEVVDTVQVVVAQVDKVVGTKHLAGGYPAIKFLLGLGLGIQNYCSNANAAWSLSVQQGELLAERKLMPYKSRIEQLVDDPHGEEKLIQILENALI
ncbi:MAG: 50S ribosome-binding GTPase [Woronichinia naegeliana WA131]|uniref:50S ribosome-binding GTPase n=1 Tax=Woronichinia naegeliana WA131 TaxID=2824559 RepID=A0A977PW27_9CYAN|nr:MAG: 50S ribosome-binding GTPase [Woronichinia naegeliana WA131]